MMAISDKHAEMLEELWYNKSFQLLIEMLKNRIDILGKGVLIARDVEVIKEYQMEAQIITKFIKSIKTVVDKRKKQRDKEKK